MALSILKRETRGVEEEDPGASGDDAEKSGSELFESVGSQAECKRAEEDQEDGSGG